MKRSFLIFILLASLSPLRSQSLEADTIFRRFFANAVAYAEAYPREKVHLHFDNSSYYVGDTIRFKAYAVLAGSNVPSTLSKPLYVEMLDQAGHINQRQIVEMKEGVAHGQIVLDESTLSGYYEIRAYTRWMQAFGESVCFSRTFPVYQYSPGKAQERHISTYRLNASMEQRPRGTEERLALQFFPEGGSLVQGVPSRVAFKAESRDEGNVSLKGRVCTQQGEVLAELETLHDGMGVFSYTPGMENAVARVTYKGKEYRFSLPEPLPTGYVLSVNNAGGALVGSVACNGDTPGNDLMVLISHEGRPCDYRVLHATPGTEQTFVLKTHQLPGGIYQVTLLDRSGHIRSERFTFVQPRGLHQLEVQGVQQVYRPYEPIRCKVRLTDSKGRPQQGNFSVSVRNALSSDYREEDNNLFTDLLLTSGLKGYIHRPGYYFSNLSLRKLQELDALLMVHGWRQYDLSQSVLGAEGKLPQGKPEEELLLHGEVRSSVLKNRLKDIEVGLMAKSGDGLVVGQTVTDAKGKFQLSVTAFEGEVEALFQTRRQGSRWKKDASVMLDRNFSPSLRAYAYEETHPQWVDKNRWNSLAHLTDSLYADSLRRTDDAYWLDQVEVVSKRKDHNLTTQVFENSVDAYYDVSKIVDELRDRGETIFTIPDLMRKLNPNFIYDPIDGSCRYKEKTICLVVGERVLDSYTAQTLWTEVDGIKRIMICEGPGSYTNEVLDSARELDSEQGRGIGPDRGAGRTFDDSFYFYGDAAKKSRDRKARETPENNPFRIKAFSFNDNVNKNIDLSRLGQYALFYITPIQDLDYLRLTQKSMKADRGTRRTMIQGYTRPMDFYSPVYKEGIPDFDADYRRTLYWNPDVRTDENGEAVIECYNGSGSNPVIVEVEMLKDGVPCASSTEVQDE